MRAETRRPIGWHGWTRDVPRPGPGAAAGPAPARYFNSLLVSFILKLTGGLWLSQSQFVACAVCDSHGSVRISVMIPLVNLACLVSGIGRPGLGRAAGGASCRKTSLIFKRDLNYDSEALSRLDQQAYLRWKMWVGQNGQIIIVYKT